MPRKTGQSQRAETEELLSEEEKAAMREYVQEKKARRSGRLTREDEERAVREKIATLPEPDRTLAERIHAIITTTAPELVPRLWYGMPAYAKDGKVICFFQGAHKFNTRYATLGFSDAAHLDEGAMWPTAYALTELTPTEEAKIAALVRKALD